MSLFRVQSNGEIFGVKTEEFPDEKTIEDLIEKQPSIILGGEPLLIIGRQVVTGYGTKIDLLGLESSGNTVIVELKLGLTPREVVTQILEYAVWIQNLQYAELNKIAIDQLRVKSLREHYLSYFGELGAIENIIENVNREQLLIILAKEIDEKIEDISRYLREKGINLKCLKYSYFSGNSGEKYLHIDTVVGKEPRRGTLPLTPEVLPEIYKMFDKVLEEIKTEEFSAPEVFKMFSALFPNEMAKLQEKYKDTPHFSVKTFIAKRLIDYSKRESAPFFVTDKVIRAPADWGWPEVKVFKKKH